jgi:hypothetical protein
MWILLKTELRERDLDESECLLYDYCAYDLSSIPEEYCKKASEDFINYEVEIKGLFLDRKEIIEAYKIFYRDDDYAEKHELNFCSWNEYFFRWDYALIQSYS